jgi:hypothetical protein
MMLSTFWLALAAVLAFNGSPLTAGIIALPWFIHHRWEQHFHAAQLSKPQPAAGETR